ncbi:MAG: replicative DNA helicase [Candidatus Absconditabacteria bacterium]|nr:replicative DNA helicase [Candidatus Absconditabacteria bacterium]MDD3868343.1 replicative DNA helicase [Candidatus Absconditabacteria bacterium]MDD4714418.1 replicative DNA helicase [Candidatus Absconditabacteria bacterium]
MVTEYTLPPHNIEAEKGVISGALMDRETVWIFEGDGITHKDFYQKEHGFIYEAIHQLRGASKTIDVITVSDQLSKNGNLESIGGLDYLYELSGFLISTAPCVEYSKIVKEKSLLRQVLKVCQQITGDAYQQKDAIQIFDDIEKKIFELTQNQIGDGIEGIDEILKGRIEEYMEIVDNPEKFNERKVNSGYSKIDEMLTGFKPGELIIVAARPSMGKTAFALNLLTNIALQQKKTVAIFSLEMSSEAIVDRIMSEVSSVPMYKINKGDLDNSDFAKMGDAMEKLSDGQKIFIDDKGGLTVPILKSKLRKLKIEKKALDLVIVDYLQLMHATTFVGNRVQEISEISRGLKELAKELEVPVIALSQLSRAVEQRVDKKPQLSDLRESGAIEQDADSVLMLHREDYYDPDTDKKGATDVCIRKNRNGAVGEVELHFQKEIMKFIEKKKERTDGTY